MKFCVRVCPTGSFVVPPDDTRPRFVCSACGTIHYQNPKMVVGSIPVWEEDGKMQILLCKRAIEPRYGYWTLPAGFMENGETTEQAAYAKPSKNPVRTSNYTKLFSLLNVPHVHQVHLFYRATLRDLDYAAGTESLEVKMFSAAEIPWDDIAFPTVTHTLQMFLADYESARNGGGYGFHTLDILKSMRKPD